MSAQICILLIIVTISMIILFRKIVRTDSHDDFKIKNILKYDENDDITNDDFENIQNNIKESVNFSKNHQDFRTETHSQYEKEVNKETIKEKSQNYQPEKEIYENFIDTNTSKPTKIKKDIIQMIKSFYRGITFTIGILVCLYSLFGIIKFVQTTDDAIIYSIWLLIGVILIK